MADQRRATRSPGSWDEQPVCRKCTGTTSLTGSPNFVWFASPESDGHGEFSPQRIQQVKWTSPVTSKLLLEAGFGTTYYEWGGKQLEDTSTENLVQMLNLTQAVTPTFSTAMRYRSQFWLNNKTRGSQFNASAAYITGSHSMKFGYQGAYWRDDREQHVNSQSLGYIGISLPGVPFFPISINAVHQPVRRQRARHAGVVLRAGQLDDEPPHAAGRAALRPPLELVPGTDRSRSSGSSRARPSPRPTA